MATSKKAPTKKTDQLATDFVQAKDPTGEPGHKKMNLKTEFGKDTADNERSKKSAGIAAVNRADNIRQKESPQRRVPGPGK
ncbi:MAG: hypothetical protein H7328_08620 [Bdellovibrio sp.]|nr:hypothetical protein [Bdellovibrio sp.]